MSEYQSISLDITVPVYFSRINGNGILVNLIWSFCISGYPFLAGPEVIKLFYMLNSTEQKIIMLINVKMPTVVGILTFISMLNATSESLKARKSIFFSSSVFFVLHESIMFAYFKRKLNMEFTGFIIGAVFV